LNIYIFEYIYIFILQGQKVGKYNFTAQ
jgi:hypothetical protein